MNAVMDKLPGLVAEELEEANRRYPPFASAHEGYAVMLEELEETKEAIVEVELDMERLWECIRSDSTQLMAPWSKHIAHDAQKVAAEAVQIAAMAKKMLSLLDKKNNEKE